MTIQTARQKYGQQIALGDLDLLIADVIGHDSTFVQIHPEVRLSLVQTIKLAHRVWQRRRGYSVAVILGHKEFFGLDFLVTKDTLVPRPETELLVEEALKNCTDETALIDVGTGSGCIAISILTQKPMLAYAVENSSRAAKVALQNAMRHQISLSILSGNLLTPIPKKTFEKPLVITANLPYLTHQQWHNEPSIHREPYFALVADTGGLGEYITLLAQLQDIHCTKPITLFFEIDPSQTEAIKKWVRQFFPAARIEIKNDLAGQDRLVIIKLNS